MQILITGSGAQAMKKQLVMNALLLLLIGSTSPVQAMEKKEPVKSVYDGLSLGVGLEYEEGDYGTGDTTRSWVIPVNVRYRSGNMAYEVSVPYISAESDGEITIRSAGGRHTTSKSGTTAPQNESGIGDISFAASYFLPPVPNKELYPFITARVTLDTGDEVAGLGTGESSYAQEFSLDKYLSNDLYFATIGYELINDAPGVDYDDVLYGLVGMMHPLDRRFSAGGSLYYAQASTPGFDDLVELNALFRQKLDTSNTLSGYILLGLSDSAADWGAGINVRHYF